MEAKMICPACGTAYSLQARVNVKVQCSACGTLFEPARSTAARGWQVNPFGKARRSSSPAPPPRLPATEEFPAPPLHDAATRRRRRSAPKETPLGLTIALAVTGTMLASMLLILAFRPKASLIPLPQASVSAAQQESDRSPDVRESSAVDSAPEPTTLPAAPLRVPETLPGSQDARGPDTPLGPELALPELIEMVEPSVVRITGHTVTSDILGSGFVVAADGRVATNYHVVEGTYGMRVEFANKHSGPVLGYRILDPENDLAILQIDAAGLRLRPLPLASQLPRKGQAVAAFGAPLGLDFTTSNGIVSATRPAAELDGFDLGGTLIQTTAPISSGNSGGPLVDMHGVVVGVNTLGSLKGQNLNFAVSSLHVQEMLDHCGDRVYPQTPYGRLRRGWR